MRGTSGLVEEPLVSQELCSMESVGYKLKTPFQATGIHTIYPSPLPLTATSSTSVDIPEVGSCLAIYRSIYLYISHFKRATFPIYLTLRF